MMLPGRTRGVKGKVVCNSQKKREAARKYHLENPEKYREYARKYYLENPEKYREKNRKYYLENREKNLEYARKYRLKNREKIREKKLERERSRGVQPQKTYPIGAKIVEKDGYVVIKVASGLGKKNWVREHRLVIEEALGRTLFSWESVHHKNNVKDDNRIENLELISGSHFKGARVVDLIRFAREILEKYDPSALAD